MEVVVSSGTDLRMGQCASAISLFSIRGLSDGLEDLISPTEERRERFAQIPEQTCRFSQKGQNPLTQASVIFLLGIILVKDKLQKEVIMGVL